MGEHQKSGHKLADITASNNNNSRLEVPSANGRPDHEDDHPSNVSHLTPRLVRKHLGGDELHSYSTDHPDVILSELEHGNQVVTKSFRRIGSDGNLEIPENDSMLQDTRAVASPESSHQDSFQPNNKSDETDSSRHIASTLSGAGRKRSTFLVTDGNKLQCIKDSSSPMILKQTGGLEIQRIHNQNEDVGEDSRDFLDWLHYNPMNSEVYNPFTEDWQNFVGHIFQPYSLYRCRAHLTRTQECYFFMMGAVSLILLIAFFTCSLHLEKSFSSSMTMPKVGLCFLLPAYIAMVTAYVYRGRNLPVKAFGIPALVYMLILSIVTACLIFLDISIPSTVWYVLLIVLGACGGVYMSVLHIMSSLFPGGRSVCMVLWGIGFAFLLPALGELAFVLYNHFIPDADWIKISRIKSCAIFALSAFFIVWSIYGLHVLTRSGIFRLFRGKRIFSNQNTNGDINSEHRIHWSDTWGFLLLQFTTAGITVYIFVGARTVAIATKNLIPQPLFYDSFWETFHFSLLVTAFLLGGFFGMLITVMSRFKTVVDSNCAIASLFTPSVLRIGLIVIYIIYIKEPFLTSQGVLTISLYFFTAFTEVIVQNSLASYCQKLCGAIPKKLVNCNVAQVCMMTQLLGATTGVALSFIEL